MKEKYKVGLIDDEENILEILMDEISRIPDFEVGFATVDPVKGLEYAIKGQVDVLITDLLMPGLGGLEISRRLLDTGIPVIICSGHSKYAVLGFKVEALDFLEKPPNPLELSEALIKAKKKIDSLHWTKKEIEEDYVVIGDKLGHFRQVVRPKEILYMEQRLKESIVKLEDGSEFTLVSPFMSSLKKLKSRNMIRVHQSFAVNVLKVRKLRSGICELVSGDEIPVSLTYKDELRRIFESRLIS